MRAHPGFTAFELVVTTFVVALVGGAIYAFQTNVITVNTFLQDSLTGQQEARVMLRKFVSEARTTQIPDTGSYPLATVTTTEFAFYANVDADAARERVRYFVSGTTLRRGVIQPAGNPVTYAPATEVATDLVHNLANGATPVFQYYDANYTGSSAALAAPIDPLDVRLVKVTLIVDRNPNRPPAATTVTTQVSLRNLKDNL